MITYDRGCQRVVESRDGLPGRDAWLLARRSVNDPTDIAYYLSNAPVDTPLVKLAQVASTRYTVEQCIEEAKGGPAWTNMGCVIGTVGIVISHSR